MRRIYMFFLPVIVVLLSSCNLNFLQKSYDPFFLYDDTVMSGSSQNFEKAEKLLPYEQMITKYCDIHTFAQMFATQESGRGALSSVADNIGIECLRTNAAGIYYSIHKVEQGGLLYIFYNTWGFISNWFYVQKNLCYKDFQRLKIGDSIDEVKKIDPATQIFENVLIRKYEKNSKVNAYGYSAHYLDDGVLKIQYEYKDKKFVILGMELYGDYVWSDDGLSGKVDMWDVSLLPGDWIS